LSEHFVARAPALAYRMIGGETIIMVAGDATLFSLDEVASFIWQRADGRTPLRSIVEAICEEYDVAPAVARHDAEEFVASLAGRGLLVIRSHGAGEEDRKVMGKP